MKSSRVFQRLLQKTIMVAAALCIVLPTHAQPPRFNYQARLTNSGAPIQGTHTIYFWLYRGGSPNVANDGTLLFQESASLSVDNGIVNHAVGTGANLFGGSLTSAMLQTQSDVFVQVAVDVQSNVVLPRTRLSSVPYSLLSADGERRIALPGPAPIIISTPGSYLLTANLGVTGGDAITITTSAVTLDLNGFTISSSSASNTGTGIKLQGAIRDIAIRNGHITGSVTYNSNTDTYSGPGFSDGINYTTSSLTSVVVTDVSVSGCKNYGIILPEGTNSRIDSCLAQTIRFTGLSGNVIHKSAAYECGGTAISSMSASNCSASATGFGLGMWASNTASDCTAIAQSSLAMFITTAHNCYGQSNGGMGICAHVAENCYGASNSYIGLQASNNAINCSGSSVSGSGLEAGSAENCRGNSHSGVGVQIFGTALNCKGISNLGTGLSARDGAQNCVGESNGSQFGLMTSGTAVQCRGYSVGNRGLHADKSAQNCYGESGGGGAGVFAGIATNCYGKSNTGTGVTFTKAGAMCFGERTTPAATNSVLGAGMAGPVNLP